MKLIFSGPSERGSHRISAAADCLRNYAFLYRGGENGEEHRELLQRTPNGMLQGTLLHIALAHHYKIKQLKEWDLYPDIMENAGVKKERVEDYYSPREAIWHVAEERARIEDDPNWISQAPVIIQAYEDYNNYFGDDSHWIIIGVEYEYRARIGKGLEGMPEEGYLYTQRADLIVMDKVGQFWIIDHKKTARISSRSLEQHALEGQFLGYQLFGNTLYKNKFGGVLVNRVSPQAKQTKFDRSLVPPSPQAVFDYRQHIMNVEERITAYEDCINPMSWPPKFTMGCYGRYGKCQHWDKCRG